MKRDLTEFKQVVQTDAVAAVSSTAAMLKEKLSVSSCLINVVLKLKSKLLLSLYYFFTFNVTNLYFKIERERK